MPRQNTIPIVNMRTAGTVCISSSSNLHTRHGYSRCHGLESWRSLQIDFQLCPTIVQRRSDAIYDVSYTEGNDLLTYLLRYCYKLGKTKRRKSTLAAEIRSIVKKKRLIWMNENNQILNLGEFTFIKASVRLLLK